MLQYWLKAFRLRTLPLAAAGIMLGSAMSYDVGNFSMPVFVLALVTTFLLQILSNLANDYGDFKNGIDNDNRVGPQRTLQSGAITQQAMKKAMYIFAALSLVFGVALLIVAFAAVSVKMILFFLMGILCIVAALKYTIGKTNFGYKGLGDVVVFIFFGPVAVCGVYFLHTFNMDYFILLPATAIGLLSSAVLNVNNLRDVENDRECGKNTLVVKMGYKVGKLYHSLLILSSIALCIVYFWHLETHSLLFIIPVVLLMVHLIKVIVTKVPAKLDKELKRLAISTFIASLIMSFVLCA